VHTCLDQVSPFFSIRYILTVVIKGGFLEVIPIRDSAPRTSGSIIDVGTPVRLHDSGGHVTTHLPLLSCSDSTVGVCDSESNIQIWDSDSGDVLFKIQALIYGKPVRAPGGFACNDELFVMFNKPDDVNVDIYSMRYADAAADGIPYGAADSSIVICRTTTIRDPTCIILNESLPSQAVIGSKGGVSVIQLALPPELRAPRWVLEVNKAAGQDLDMLHGVRFTTREYETAMKKWFHAPPPDSAFDEIVMPMLVADPPVLESGIIHVTARGNTIVAASETTIFCVTRGTSTSKPVYRTPIAIDPMFSILQVEPVDEGIMCVTSSHGILFYAWDDPDPQLTIQRIDSEPAAMRRKMEYREVDGEVVHAGPPPGGYMAVTPGGAMVSHTFENRIWVVSVEKVDELVAAMHDMKVDDSAEAVEL
jgi:hypothetical protein